MPIIGRKIEFRQPACSKPTPQPPTITVVKNKPKKAKKYDKKLELQEKLEQIKGVGKKIASEIVEEYSDEKTMIEDIENGKFKVGGINKKKIDLVLKSFK